MLERSRVGTLSPGREQLEIQHRAEGELRCGLGVEEAEVAERMVEGGPVAAGPVGASVFAPDGGTLVSAGACSYNEWGAEIDVDPTVRVWDLGARGERFRMRGHAGSTTRVDRGRLRNTAPSSSWA